MKNEMRSKIKGLVIKEQDKGESGKLLTVLTETNGVITVNAKGVRKLSAAYMKSAQLFALSEMLLYETNGFYTLTEASLITDFYSLREDVVSFALACYICEAAGAFAVPGDEGTELMRLVLNSLYALEKKLCEPKKVKAAFEIRLCAASGFSPDTDECAFCGSPLSNGGIFDGNEGAIMCLSCGKQGANNGIPVSADVIKTIKHISECEQSRLLSFSFVGSDAATLCVCAEKFLLSCAERPFRTLSFLKTLI